MCTGCFSDDFKRGSLLRFLTIGLLSCQRMSALEEECFCSPALMKNGTYLYHHVAHPPARDHPQEVRHLALQPQFTLLLLPGVLLPPLPAVFLCEVVFSFVWGSLFSIDQ